MKNYEIVKLRNEPYDFLVIATSYISPLDSIENIIGTVGQENPNLIFDLTLINGANKNRYIEMKHSNKGVAPKFSIVKTISPNIRTISSSFFTSHHNIVDKSVIPNSLKFLLKHDYI
jgi:hypothetical protein